MITLGSLGTGLALLIQYGLVAEVGPTTGQMVTYFVPVIATAAGVAVLSEPLHWNTPVGAVIVLVGAALTQSRSGGSAAGRKSAPPIEPQPTPGPAPTTARADQP